MQATGLMELEAVVAVARCRNFRIAAAELNRSRSAVSHTVAALEQRLGVRLFNRTTRSVSLTEAGELFVGIVAPALAEIRRAVATASSRRSNLGGTSDPFFSGFLETPRPRFAPIWKTRLRRFAPWPWTRAV